MRYWKGLSLSNESYTSDFYELMETYRLKNISLNGDVNAKYPYIWGDEKTLILVNYLCKKKRYFFNARTCLV
jgi:hypothetical protein